MISTLTKISNNNNKKKISDKIQNKFTLKNSFFLIYVFMNCECLIINFCSIMLRKQFLQFTKGNILTVEFVYNFKVKQGLWIKISLKIVETCFKVFFLKKTNETFELYGALFKYYYFELHILNVSIFFQKIKNEN